MLTILLSRLLQRRIQREIDELRPAEGGRGSDQGMLENLEVSYPHLGGLTTKRQNDHLLQKDGYSEE